MPGSAPRPVSSQSARWSASERIEGASPGGAMRAQAAGETASAETPAWPPSAFCGPITATSMPSASTSSGMAADRGDGIDDEERAVALRVRAPTASSGLRMP